MSHTSFVTTTRGLNRDLPPMRLYEKAKNGKFLHALHVAVLFQALAYLNRVG
ncbi:MAG: hypothetical protein Q8L87_15160 [Anaerolineales bacterium]|nr:hypothetical protein [Anaerolineales bacterium]